MAIQSRQPARVTIVTNANTWLWFKNWTESEWTREQLEARVHGVLCMDHGLPYGATMAFQEIMDTQAVAEILDAMRERAVVIVRCHEPVPESSPAKITYDASK